MPWLLLLLGVDGFGALLLWMADVEAFQALADSIGSVLGKRPVGVGIGGGTCANFFRQKGLDAYVWQYGGGTLHAPNEHVPVENIVIDAKVYATLIHRLCLQ